MHSLSLNFCQQSYPCLIGVLATEVPNFIMKETTGWSENSIFYLFMSLTVRPLLSFICYRDKCDCKLSEDFVWMQLIWMYRMHIIYWNNKNLVNDGIVPKAKYHFDSDQGKLQKFG